MKPSIMQRVFDLMIMDPVWRGVGIVLMLAAVVAAAIGVVIFVAKVIA